MLQILIHACSRRRCAGLCHFLFLLCLLSAWALPRGAWAQLVGLDPQTVQVSATVQASPPQIRLHWPLNTSITSYTIYKKLLTDSTWGNPIVTNLSGMTTGYTVNSGIVVGTAYEFEIIGRQSSATAYGYLASGINLPLVDNRGKVILMVEQTTGSQLTAGLTQLINDLLGDGWTVIRHNVSSTDRISYVQSLVSQDYRADPSNVKALFLFGNVPIPKSGWLAPLPGEETATFLPFPTDLYYGIIGGAWTDMKNFGTGSETETNLARDGKFDQNTVMDLFQGTILPSAPVSLEVGRVDLSNLPAFSGYYASTNASEVDLLNNYLRKDHDYRTAAFSYRSQGLIDDQFTGYYYNNAYSAEDFAQNGWRNFAPFFGAQNLVQGNFSGDSANNFFVTDSSHSPLPYLWAYGCGSYSYSSSSYYSDSPNIYTSQLQTTDPAVFTMLFGGKYGEWDGQDDLLRAVLATPNYGLTSCWGGRPNWYFHRMGIGNEIGESVRLTQNNINGLYLPTDTFVSGTTSTTYNGNLYVNLMGDPTLRLSMPPPPTTLTAKQVGDHAIQLSWAAPNNNTNLAGYAVYRVSNANGPVYGPVTRIDGSGNSFLSGTTFTDTTPMSQVSGASNNSNTYIVRAVQLDSSTSSSYYNGSEGTMVSFTPLFTPPTTNPISYDVGENTTLTVPASSGVLSVDINNGGNPLTATQFSTPQNGTLVSNADGSFTYTPTTGYTGQDTFTYQASDGYALSAIATVTINIHTLPTANDDGPFPLTMNGVLTVAKPGVLGNDTDGESLPLTAVQTSTPTHGTLTLNTDGSFTYTPLPFFTGTDNFTYQASNGYCTSGTATVSILVDNPPTANNDSYTTNQGIALSENASSGVLSNDANHASNTSTHPLTAIMKSAPSNGILTLNTDGSFTYSPAAGFSGTDSFTYQATDGYTNSNIATVTLTVNPLPFANNDRYPLNAGAVLTVAAPGILVNDADAAGDPLTASLVSGPTNGTLQLNPDGSFTYTPNAAFYGQDSFTYLANNHYGSSLSATVTLNVNAVPVAVNSAYTTVHDVTLTVTAPGVLAKVSDPDNGPSPLAAILKDNVAHGTLTLNTNGSFTYVPKAGYFGADSFAYRASDGDAYSTLARVSLTVYGAPIAGTANYAVNQNTVLQVAAPGILSQASDPNGLPLTISLVKNVTYGTLALNADGSFTYTPAHNFISTDVWISTDPNTGIQHTTGIRQDSFTYQVSDGKLTSTIATVAITVNPTGYKGDVAPRPDGNGTVAIADWVQVGRFVAGIDTLADNNPSEALRAHCASSNTAPLGITDWVEAALLAAGLDSLQPARSGIMLPHAQALRSLGRGATRVSLGNLTLSRGARGAVSVVLTALGTEEALGFTLSYDARRVRLLSVTPVGMATGAHLLLNNAGVSRGKVGVLLMLPTSKTFPTGSATMLRCTFTALPAAPRGSTPVTFSDAVTARSASDNRANSLPTTMTGGSILIR